MQNLITSNLYTTKRDEHFPPEIQLRKRKKENTGRCLPLHSITHLDFKLQEYEN